MSSWVCDRLQASGAVAGAGFDKAVSFLIDGERELEEDA
jgi:hypothetical protein